MRHVVFKLLVLGLAMSFGAVGVVAVEIPVENDATAVLPAFLTEVVTGAPADSLVLRVSFHSRPGDGRFDTRAFIVVEELVWPFPPPQMRIDVEGQVDTVESEPSCPQVVTAVSRIEGWYLNQARRDMVSTEPSPGMRAGELGGHWVRPFEFVEWLSPLQFVVTDGRGRFEIRWIGRGVFELDSVVGVR